MSRNNPQRITQAVALEANCWQVKKGNGLVSGLDPLGAFLRKWHRYETGIRPTSIGYIYGAERQIERARRLIDVREVQAQAQDIKDREAWYILTDLWRKGYITAIEGVFQ